MSSEARITNSLQIRKGNLTYQSQPSAFIADVSGTNGPTPGAVTVSINGTTIALTQLTAVGGLCRLMNLDPTNYVEYGVLDVGSNTFYPLGELLPGETYILRLSRKLLKDEVGTGTFGSNCVLRMKAIGGACIVLAECFDP